MGLRRVARGTAVERAGLHAPQRLAEKSADRIVNRHGIAFPGDAPGHLQTCHSDQFQSGRRRSDFANLDRLNADLRVRRGRGRDDVSQLSAPDPGARKSSIFRCPANLARFRGGTSAKSELVTVHLYKYRARRHLAGSSVSQDAQPLAVFWFALVLELGARFVIGTARERYRTLRAGAFIKRSR